MKEAGEGNLLLSAQEHATIIRDRLARDAIGIGVVAGPVARLAIA